MLEMSVGFAPAKYSRPGRTILSEILECLRTPCQPHIGLTRTHSTHTTKLAIVGATSIAYRGSEREIARFWLVQSGRTRVDVEAAEWSRCVGFKVVRVCRTVTLVYGASIRTYYKHNMLVCMSVCPASYLLVHDTHKYVQGPIFVVYRRTSLHVSLA